jgi:hypothetical protein
MKAIFNLGSLTKARLAAVIFAVSGGFFCGASESEAQNSFTFLESGFTQTLYGNAPGGFGSPAFAPNGDVWVRLGCLGGPSGLDRFVAGTTVADGHGGMEHPLAVGSPFALISGCGLTNHPDGTIYANTGFGVRNLDANTGALLRTFGPGGNSTGITVDPQTNNVVYVGVDCRFAVTCTIVTINPITGISSAFAVLPSTTASFIDGIYFDPGGNYLFMSNRGNTGSPTQFHMTILDRTGTVVNDVGMTSEPDGIAFHVNPSFVVTNNTDGTMTRFDFPSNVFTAPPVQSLFASGGFRGDLTQVGPDSCLYLSQEGTRFADNTTSGNNSIVQICPSFAPPPGVSICPVGTPGEPNCHGQCISALAQKYNGINAAASALRLSSVSALQNAVRTFCGG